MLLSPEQAERYYRIWWPLLTYVNDQRQLTPGLSAAEPRPMNLQEAFPLRQALWEDDGLREAFIAENPAGLSQADLDIVSSWQYRAAGSFFILRYLKKHTVFLSQHTPVRAYAVLGLMSAIEDIVGPSLPVLVQAVLLPFEDKIVYDGILSPYNVYFGPGIRSGLKDAYRDAQERTGVLTSLLPAGPADVENVRKEIQGRNKKLLDSFRKDLAASSLSLKMIEEHSRNIEAFANGFLLEQMPPRRLLDIDEAGVQQYMDAGKVNVTSFKRFVYCARVEIGLLVKRLSRLQYALECAVRKSPLLSRAEYTIPGKNRPDRVGGRAGAARVPEAKP